MIKLFFPLIIIIALSTVILAEGITVDITIERKPPPVEQPACE